MDEELAGRTAIVTGASKGIGLAVSRALAGAGALVVAGARSSSAELDELAGGGRVRFVPVNLGDPAGPAALTAAAGERIDILVNNVGSAPARPGGFLSITDADWDVTLTLNLLAAVRATRAVLPAMLAAGTGAIISVCSVNARLPDPAVLDYSTAKGGLAAFSKGLSKEVGPRGIRVNTVSPGPVSTGLWLGEHGVAASVAGATGGDPAAVAKSAVSTTATGRFTTPEEVADLVVLLAGARAGNVTGADIVIDGGLVQTI
jgi:NAD(P)-dependent dehydrogenase (short-subunit alcohol dehydrogenase family)